MDEKSLKDIKSYFQVDIDAIRPSKDPLLFNIYLYLKQNQHILVFRKKGEVLTTEFIERYRTKGIKQVWIHDSDRIQFQEYLGEPAPKPEVAATQTPTDPQIQSGKMIDLLKNSTL